MTTALSSGLKPFYGDNVNHVVLVVQDKMRCLCQCIYVVSIACRLKIWQVHYYLLRLQVKVIDNLPYKAICASMRKHSVD